MPSQQQVVLTFTWDGQQQAQIYYVIDNGKSKVLAANDLKGKGRVTASFKVAMSATHLLKWSLWFPGKTLKNLELSASVDGESRELDSAATQEHHWASEGTWRL